MATISDKRSFLPARRTKIHCRRCGRFRGEIYTDLCRDCVEQTLHKHLPRLQRILEERYGQQLDEWLTSGSLSPVHWVVSSDFTVSQRVFRRFLMQLMKEAGENQDIWLALDGCQWTPTRVGQLVNSIYERCESTLRPLIAQQVAVAIRQSPTTQAKRELIGLASHQLEARSIEALDKAVEALADTSTSGLPGGVKVLIELRYKLMKDSLLYTEVTEGSIHPVWQELGEALPKAVRKILLKEKVS